MDRRALLLASANRPLALLALLALAASGCVCSLVIDPDPALMEGDGGEGDGGGDCDDGIGCTFDREVDGVCTHEPDDGICGEGSYCFPVSGCLPLRTCAHDEDCDDGDACTVDACDRERGACAVPTTTDCSDGVFCNGDELCDPATGACSVGLPRDCRDAFDCTEDSCDDAGGACVHVPHDELCDDDRACNGAEVCDTALGCRPGTPACPDDGDCAPERCIEEVAGEPRCVTTPDHGACDAGSICVSAGAGAFSCQVVDCAGNGPCNDGDPCNGVETCEAGSCAPGTPVTCDDGTFCNGEEVCESGACVSSLPPTCHDGASCTGDACDQGADACAHVLDDTACDDGITCNGVETCSATGCAPTPACGTESQCVRASCDVATDECTETTPPETCNGVDDDCNGEPDDAFECALGSSRECTVPCSGAAGMTPCAANCTWAPICIVVEKCNGTDDDCDGDVDEGC